MSGLSLGVICKYGREPSLALFDGHALSYCVVSNLFLGEFYVTLPFVLASFALTVYLGTRLREHRDALSIGGASLAASLIFFIFTNVAHWGLTPDYPKTSAGLFSCLSAAIPFFRNTLIGDLTFTAVFFGGFALLERRFPVLRDVSLSSPLRLRPR